MTRRREFMNTAMQLMPLILLIFIMYFLLIRPQKKREKETAQMRNSLQVGDEIITIGGLCGKIVKLKDESLIIQVGADKVKFEVMRWAISKVVNSDQAAAAKSEICCCRRSAPEESKKVMPKKLGKKNAEETAAPVADQETAEPAPQTEEPVIEVPAEDVEVLEK
jgi:preprotein translocase subunit YajC